MKIFNVKWTSFSAGPSTDSNKRTEVFLAGCKMAMEGHPCKGCFNPRLWNPDHCVADVSPIAAVENIMLHAPNKFITFVGGEPLDQIHDLAETCRMLKEQGYHILVITHYKLEDIINKDIMPYDESFKLLKNIDILIDGKYDADNRIWDEDKAGDGLHDVVGSGNQVIWDIREWNKTKNCKIIEGYPAGKLACIGMNMNEDLIYIILNNDIKEDLLSMKINKEIAA